MELPVFLLGYLGGFTRVSEAWVWHTRQQFAKLTVIQLHLRLSVVEFDSKPCCGS